MTGWWLASYVLLWLLVALLALAVAVLLRHIGVLHARLRPLGVHPAGEGPPVGVPAPPLPGVDYHRKPLTLLAFTAEDCPICAELVPALPALDRSYRDVAVHVVAHTPETEPVFRAFGVRSTPYVVAVDGDGTVRGGGVANSLEQVEVLVEGAFA